MTQRYFAKIAYNGISFSGWQRQPNKYTIQEEIENTISKIVRKSTKIVGCGRTDTGVHAKEYYFHFDLHCEIDIEKFRYKLNCILSKNISCSLIQKTKHDFHARFSAIYRTYQYFIHQNKDPFLYGLSMYYNKNLDIDLMNQACLLLIGRKDFSCFSKSKRQTNNDYCDITFAKWKINNQNQLCFTITANRFLKNMVRAIVGTMIEIGIKKYPFQSLEKIIALKNRSNAGFSVPAEGLYLTSVQYEHNK